MHQVRRGETSKAKLMLAPIAVLATTASSQWFDRHDEDEYAEASFLITLGATAGTPTSFSVIATVEESADKSTVTTATDYAGSNLTTTLTAAGTMARLHFAPATLKRYFRLTRVTAFVDGSTPSVITGVVLEVDGAQKVPVDSTALATEA
jgi:hypothetical protein